MTTSRRNFLATGLATMGTAASLDAAEADDEPATIECLDYGRSFICNTATYNAVRFWIESRTTLIDEKNNKQTVIYQCASCKSENTFGKSDLFLSPNYDFMPSFGGADLLIFRRHAHATEQRSTRQVMFHLNSPFASFDPRASPMVHVPSLAFVRGQTISP